MKSTILEPGISQTLRLLIRPKTLYHVGKGDVSVPSRALFSELGGAHRGEGNLVNRRGVNPEDAIFLPFLLLSVRCYGTGKPQSGFSV